MPVPRRQTAARYSQALHEVLDLFAEHHRGADALRDRDRGADALRDAEQRAREPQQSSQTPALPAAGDGVPVLDSMGADLIPLLHRLVDAVLRAAGWDRAALLLYGDESDGVAGVVASDDPDRGPVLLGGDEADRAALRALLRTGQPTLIKVGAQGGLADGTAILLRALRGSPQAAGPLLLVPILVDELAVPGGSSADTPQQKPPAPTQWALVLERAAPLSALPESLADFLGLAAQIAGLGLRGRRVTEAVRDRTRRFSLPRLAAERRREAALQYRAFFESSADGVMVLDAQGGVVYLNRIAEQLTGYSAAGLGGHPIVEFLPQTQRAGLLEAVQQILGGYTLQSFDMQLRTTSGEVLVLSVSTSAVLSRAGCAVLLFRDVTDQRVLEFDLRHTKEFLERLIDSTVDGIIASDMEGTVMVFNQGAARLTGYAPAEVIGKLPVWRLYPEGEAQRIMAQLRSGDHGGPGRLASARRTILGKSGAPIPVSLTAAIVYQDGREVATVGMLTDLRERLHIEQRLQQVQERLLVSEKHAIIAELAGTAAHELNQPLTSVMGYAGLLRRRIADREARSAAVIADSGELLEFVDTIVRESERMAEIVRKIGKITRYETKPYVGEARIIDLDKSTPPEQASPWPWHHLGTEGDK